MRKINVVWAEGLNPEELEELREQIKIAIADPTYTVIANYELHWTEIELKDDEVPKIIWADGLIAGDVDLLREQVQRALSDPNFAIITNYEVHVEGIDTIKKVEREIKPCIMLTQFQILKEN